MRSTNGRWERSRAGGVTLLELLVVIGVLMVLTVMALPTMRWGAESRRVREAARMVNVALGAARSRAAETGRPAGINLRRLNNASPVFNCVMTIDQVEMPTPYGGEDMFATATIQWAAGALNISFLGAGVNPILVHAGDTIQFNYQGPYYSITSVAANGLSATAKIIGFAGQQTPWPAGGASPALPYTIYRAWIKSVAAPVQLPAGTTVDLAFSGRESAPMEFANGGGAVIILFSPTGAVLSYDAGTGAGPQSVTEPIYLLVGKRERIRDYSASPLGATPKEDDKPNWADLTNLWVTINPQTGLVTSSEVAAVSGVTWPTIGTWGPSIVAARNFARDAQSKGGK